MLNSFHSWLSWNLWNDVYSGEGVLPPHKRTFCGLLPYYLKQGCLHFKSRCSLHIKTLILANSNKFKDLPNWNWPLSEIIRKFLTPRLKFLSNVCHDLALQQWFQRVQHVKGVSSGEDEIGQNNDFMPPRGVILQSSYIVSHEEVIAWSRKAFVLIIGLFWMFFQRGFL